MTRDWQFDRDAIETFHFRRCSLDANRGEAELVYGFDDGPDLIERLTFPRAPFELDPVRADATERALRLLHLVAGVSYYKAAVPPRIAIDSYTIDADTAGLLTLIYEYGLGEFAYRNGLDLRGRIEFPATPTDGAAVHTSPHRGEGTVQTEREALRTHFDSPPSPPGRGVGGEGPTGAGNRTLQRLGKIAPSPQPLSRRERGSKRDPLHLSEHTHALVAIGGGKDSLVTIETLRAAGIAQTVTWIGGSQLIAACAARTGLPTLNIGRALAPELFEYNRQGAWNGHIPVTAINSSILVLAALLSGADQVVFSNERSASYGSQIPGTGEVNHQWSKGWIFERAFGEHIERHVAQNLHYYSLLRPLSELAVARLFAREDRYDAWFSSCNRNFHLLGERPTQRWCSVCPKCHFVFLALAPFMPKARLVRIFGRNLLDDAALAPAFDALLEFGAHKPFECVGEGRESRAAFAAIANRAEWREDAMVVRFTREIAPRLPAGDLELAPLLGAGEEHRIPPDVWARIHAHLDI